MSSVSDNEFKFEIRKIKYNKDDYSDNKKEKFLFKYLSEGASFLPSFLPSSIQKKEPKALSQIKI